MANHTWNGSTNGVMDTAANWDAIPTAVQGVLIFNPTNWAGGTAPTTAMTIDGTWGLSLAGGANLTLAGLLGDLVNQVVVDVTLVTASIYVHDATEAITGAVSLNASIMTVSANTAITGAVALVGSGFTYNSTGTITGAVTVDATSEYYAGANHTLTGGITVTGGTMRLYHQTVTGAVVLAGGNLTMETGGIIGAITDSAGGNTISLGTAGTITGVVNLGECGWAGAGTFTANTAGALNLGGAAVGLAIDINGAGQTITAGTAVSCKTLTLTAGTYVAAQTHTVATNQVLKVAGSSTLTLTDAGLHVQVAVGTCTLGGNLSCKTLRIEAGTTLNGNSKSLTLASGRIHGYGTLTGLVPAGIIHVAPGVVNGGSNHANVIFDPYPMPLVI